MDALCSARTLAPFLKLVAAHEMHVDLVPEAFWTTDPDDRLPVEIVHGMLEHGVERFRDEQLGVKLGSTLSLGQVGPLDYLLRSAATTRESVELAGRYSMLLADGYRVAFEEWRRQALIRMEDEVSWPRSVADLTISASYKIHLRDRAPFRSAFEVWFPYAAPRDMRLYEQVFAGAALKFDAPFYAFAFDREYAREPQPGADPILNGQLRERLDSLVAQLSRGFALGPRVRRLIEQQIRDHKPASAPGVARTLRMSRRTLSRKLEREGTSFLGELDAVRRELARSYVRDGQRPLTEIAFLLGFSHVESFHRAFKRWTGSTPIVYRARSG